jgi:hypothetical protein
VFSGQVVTSASRWFTDEITTHSGQTHADSTQTEAESYYRLGAFGNVISSSSSASTSIKHNATDSIDLPPFARATTEVHALDSFQNLLFSLARFFQFTGLSSPNAHLWQCMLIAKQGVGQSVSPLSGTR